MNIIPYFEFYDYVNILSKTPEIFKNICRYFMQIGIIYQLIFEIKLF